MRIDGRITLVPIALACALASPFALAETASPQIEAGASDGVLVLDGRRAVQVTVEPQAIRAGAGREVRIVASRPPLVAVSDTYASQPRGAGLCEAGEETWFRVIDTAAHVERYARLVSSCHDDAELDDPPFTVDADTIILNLRSEPPLAVTLGADGQVFPSR